MTQGVPVWMDTANRAKGLGDSDLRMLAQEIKADLERRERNRIVAQVDELRRSIAEGLAGEAATELQKIRDLFAIRGYAGRVDLVGAVDNLLEELASSRANLSGGLRLAIQHIQPKLLQVKDRQGALSLYDELEAMSARLNPGETP
jgi:hypothetical protein